MNDFPEGARVRLGDSEVVLRASEPEDKPRANSVRWSAGWVDGPKRHRTLPEADADWQARRYFREIVAEVDGVVAARVGLEAYRQPFAELIDLCVRPDYKRRGLGELLTRKCQEEAARRGFMALFLQTELDNHAAHRLYTGMDFVPTAYNKMLRMVKFLDYPLIADFRRAYPLNQYWCTAIKETDKKIDKEIDKETGNTVAGDGERKSEGVVTVDGHSPNHDEDIAGEARPRRRAWNMEWHAYITEDYLRLRLEGGSARSDSDGVGPALTGLEWRVGQGARGLSMRIIPEEIRDLEAGHYVAIDLFVQNNGKRRESGLWQMILPPGVRVCGPETNQERVFLWEVGPGEQITQPLVLQIEPGFDMSALWYLNYNSLPISVEAFWDGHRALLSAAIPMAVPPPIE